MKSIHKKTEKCPLLIVFIKVLLKHYINQWLVVILIKNLVKFISSNMIFVIQHECILPIHIYHSLCLVFRFNIHIQNVFIKHLPLIFDVEYIIACQYILYIQTIVNFVCSDFHNSSLLYKFQHVTSNLYIFIN